MFDLFLCYFKIERFPFFFLKWKYRRRKICKVFSKRISIVIFFFLFKNLAFFHNQTPYLNREMGRYGSHGNLSEIKIKGSLIRRAMILSYELQTIFLSRFHSNTSSRHELALTFHLADSAPKVNRNCKRTGKKVFQLIKEYKWDWNHQSRFQVPSNPRTQNFNLVQNTMQRILTDPFEDKWITFPSRPV